MAKTFQKTVEDFVCEKCGAEVKGDGYTNHCPNCLWSKHVDVHPGDRAAACGGIMKPIKVSAKKDVFVITHRCVVCGHEKNNEARDGDNRDVLFHIAKEVAERS